MIDIHSHILPQIDDGSTSPNETAALLDLLGQQGVTTVVATPHFYAIKETPSAFLKQRQEAVERMLPGTGNQPQILLGAEVAYFSGIGNCEAIIPLRIENTNLILIEMPFSAWSQRMVDEICEIPMQLGLTPVLAHVNRYRHRDQFPKYMKKFAGNGIYFQCNAEAFQSLTSRRWALKLLKRNQLHFLGSDCHNLTSRPPQLQQAREAIEKKLGAEFFTHLNNTAEGILLPKNIEFQQKTIEVHI